MITKTARAVRCSIVRTLLTRGVISRARALEWLCLPLNPEDLTSPVVDDREMLDWSPEFFQAWMEKKEDDEDDAK